MDEIDELDVMDMEELDEEGLTKEQTNFEKGEKLKCVFKYPPSEEEDALQLKKGDIVLFEKYVEAIWRLFED